MACPRWNQMLSIVKVADKLFSIAIGEIESSIANVLQNLLQIERIYMANLLQIYRISLENLLQIYCKSIANPLQICCNFIANLQHF